ncbi:hypothetical protein QW180_24310 [Vibrio sinaloensis]|nr:hypothetical protein [Vibrio sinaloensis]
MKKFPEQVADTSASLGSTFYYLNTEKKALLKIFAFAKRCHTRLTVTLLLKPSLKKRWGPYVHPSASANRWL